MNEGEDRMDYLRKRLYSRARSPEEERRHALRQREEAIPRAWEHPHAKKVMPQPVRNKRSPISVFFIAALVFFVGSALFAAFYIFGERNVVSADNVDIQIQGPTATPGGEELELQISVTNKNATTLELADLLVEYPEGTRSPENVQRELLRHRESLGNIPPGERVKKSAKAVLFGEENTQKEIKVIIEYRVAGSNAIFYSEKMYPVTLSSAPISVSVHALDEVVSGQTMEFDVTVRSNSVGVVENVLLEAEYPFGFEFKEASPAPRFADTVWGLGNLAPEQEKTIRISGVMTGQDNEERVFRFAAGIGESADARKLATTFVATTRSVGIQRPFVSTQLSLGGRVSDVYAFGNQETITGEILWKNNLPDPVTDAQIELTLTGAAVLESSVSADQGFYNSVTDTIRWTKDTKEQFGRLNPGDEGIVRFGFNTKNITSAGLTNPEITLAITVRGRREGASGVPEQIESAVRKTVRIASDLTIASQLRRNSGAFQNGGPLPPKAESETLYTVSWTAANNANRVSGATITATLPSYVRWTGNTTQNSQIRFNESSRQVTWDVGEMAQGIGAGVSPKEISFQIGFTPSLSQVGEVPTLVHTQVIRGFDQFIDQEIERSTSDLTTRIQSESGIPNGHDVVVE